MKKLFFIVISSFCFCILQAQEKATPFDPKNYLEQKILNTNPIKEWSLKNKVTDERFKKLLVPGFSITISGNNYNLSNANKVIILPQDNMPCMVPDMKQFNMPVLKVEIPNRMPNTAINRNKLIGRR
jgi:hypothetical protein